MHSRTRGYLPHIIDPTGIYFLTIRLANTIPASVLVEWKQSARLKYYGYQYKVQHYLDQSFGECWLRDVRIASIVDGAIRYFDNQRYELMASTIMPNHVHVLMKLKPDFPMSSIMHSWKSFTALRANRILGRSGEFWEQEYFYRLVKSQRHLEFVLRYILNNPVKAGLCKEIFQWPWTRCSDEMQAIARKFFV